jgi:hypothetical protein
MRVTDNHYKQEYSLRGGKSDKLLLEIIGKKRVVLGEEIKKPDGVYQRIGYVGLYEVDMASLKVTVNPEQTHKIIEFDLGKKIVTIKNK